MKNELFDDIKKSKTLTVVGLSIVNDIKYAKIIKECLFDTLIDKDWFIIAESENQLFQFSLLTDRAISERVSFENLKNRMEFFYNMLPEQKHDKKNKEKNPRYLISSLQLPAFMIKTDSGIWYAPTITLDMGQYVKLTENDLQYSIYNDYINELTSAEKKYLSPKDKEMLELFDQNKVPRGIFPRNSFYGTDFYQYVIWGLVFNREGKILIHKRSDNAKDNQNMWDKSIGGHIDFKKERSTQDAAMRELIEELYTEEKKEQSGHAFSMLSEDISKMYFLGDWRMEEYGPDYLSHIALIEKEKPIGEENWVIYKIPKTFTHNTPRILPNNKGERWLRVIVDSFIFISNVGMNDETIKEMKNSQYRLVSPATLKTWIENGKDDDDNEFKITPDLKYIMTGELRDIIDKVSLAIQFSDIRKNDNK